MRILTDKMMLGTLSAYFCIGLLQINVWANDQLQSDLAPPNILLIYVDDLGYGDVAPYGNTIVETPNLDILSKRGMTFTQAYAPAPLCSPSRAAMLTGKDVARVGFEFVTKYPEDDFGWDDPKWLDKFKGLPLVPPPYMLNLPLKEITLAEALKSEGYKTGLVGKWHVAAHHQVYKGWSLTHGPKQQGFDYTAETFGVHPYANGRQEMVPDDEFPVDELTEKSIEFIKKEHDSPFFLMSSFYFVHTPLKKNIPWLYKKYKEKYPAGTREEVIYYAVNIALMDHYVGKIVAALEQTGESENTLVIFTSDNGGNPEIADNGPFRGSKWNLYEGGIRVPMIISWPGKIKEGSVCDQIISQLDFMPTFMDLAASENKPKDLDGVSLLPLLTGNGSHKTSRTLSWHFPYYHPEGEEFFEAPIHIGVADGFKSQTEPHSAWREEDYKLVYFYEDDRIELYNVKTDPSESIDIGKEKPHIRKQLFKNMQKHLSQVNARIPKKRTAW
ncbi:arylsulfatase [Echinicola strongylocentroti]|uniref:Arylsulfatase n=1 Tax=Echinicola strongylocentroti TaxID=1795355 RepID=A0A2Z4ICY8_9BACT|nr:sulfatase [Echinicola strongylocentroti]AWW28842.1 arylsulfatase [Echinicola strongylocentroti]